MSAMLMLIRTLQFALETKTAVVLYSSVQPSAKAITAQAVIDMSAIEELRARADTLFPRDGGLHPPSEVLLAWPKPNYVNPETRSWTGPIMLIVVLILTFLTFAARIWARIAVAKNAGLDDLFMTLAMLPLIGLSIAVILGITVYGFQWHAWDQTKKTFVTTRQITMAIEVTYMVSTTLIKISILCFYRRITSGTITKTFVYCVWASIAFVIAYGITFTCLIVFSCKPVEGYFRLFDIYWRLQNKLECHDEAAVTVAVAAVSTVQDFIICALPIFLVWNLHIPKTQKAALIGIFGLGLVTCVCGIMRTYYATYVYYYTYDITWYAFYGWIWTALEADLAVICASAPALKVFFKRYFNMSTNRSGYAYGHSSGNSRRTPYGKGTPDNSMGTSNMDNDGWTPDEVPLDRIKVNQVTDVIVEDRDEVMSQKSDTSTRLLTALPKPPSFVARSGPSEWEGCRTTCQAYRPGSRTSLKDDYDADIEKAVVDYRR